MFIPLRIRLWLICLPLLAVACDPAAEADPDTLGGFEGHIAELAEFLTPEEVADLEAQLARYEEATGVTLLLYTAETGVLEAMSKRLERRINLSPQGLNASAFILIARRERQIKIEVNHGLEWQIPDSVANQILDELSAAFQAEQYAAGLATAFADMYARVQDLPFAVAYNSLAEALADGPQALGQIVACQAQAQPPFPALDGEVQFDPAWYLTLRTPQGDSARLRFTRYMGQLIQPLTEATQPLEVRGRLRQLTPIPVLELMQVGA